MPISYARIALFLLTAGGAAGLTAQTIQRNHPRLLLTPDFKSTLAAKIKGSPAEQAQWNEMLAWTNLALAKNNLTAAMAAALVYQLDPAATTRTGKTFAVRACEVATYHVSDPKGYLFTDSSILSSNGYRWYGPPVALVYDWAHDACSADQRAQLEAFFLKAWTMHSTRLMVDTAPYRISNNIALGELRTQAMIAIASYDPELRPERKAWLSEVVKRMRGPMKACLTNSSSVAPLESCAGGSWPEGTEYAPESKAIVWDTFEYIRTGTTDTDLFAEMPVFVNDTLGYQLAITSPATRTGQDRRVYEPFAFRDIQRVNQFWICDRELMVRLAYTFRRLGDSPRAGLAQSWLNQVQPFFIVLRGSNGEQSVYNFLYHDPNAAVIDYRDAKVQPLNWITPFQLLSRSNWGEAATWVGFQAMQEGGDHFHADSGQFQIYRKGRWLTREALGYLSGDQTIWAGNSQSHNVPVLNFHGTYSSASRGGGAVEDWARFSRTDSGGYRAECATDESYCYAQADMSGPFRFTGYQITPDVDRFGAVRDLLYLKPDVMVVADRYKYVDGLDAVSVSMIQSSEPPVVTDNQAILTSGNQWLYINVVEPEQAQIRQRKHSDFVRVAGAKKVDRDNVDIYVDGAHQLNNNGTVTISGATGDWAVINGTWTVKLPGAPSNSASAPFRDGTAYNGERFRINMPGAFADLSSRWDYFGQDAALSIPKKVVIDGKPSELFRIEIGSGKYRNEESQLVVMQASDADSERLPATRCASNAMNVAQFSHYVVGALKHRTPPGTFSYRFNATAARRIQHYAMGLRPEKAYSVDVSTPGMVTVREAQPGERDTVKTTRSGLLAFTTGAPAEPQVR